MVNDELLVSEKTCIQLCRSKATGSLPATFKVESFLARYSINETILWINQYAYNYNVSTTTALVFVVSLAWDTLARTGSCCAYGFSPTGAIPISWMEKGGGSIVEKEQHLCSRQGHALVAFAMCALRLLKWPMTQMETAALSSRPAAWVIPRWID